MRKKKGKSLGTNKTRWIKQQQITDNAGMGCNVGKDHF